jgi:hypothetical protein
MQNNISPTIPVQDFPQINIEKEWQQFEPQQPFSNQGHGFVFAD